MKYIVATFSVACSAEAFPTACELVVAAAAEAGFESFEDCDGGVKAYAQKPLFDRKRLKEELGAFLMPDVSISYGIADVEDKDWNEQWEEAGFEPIRIDGACTIYDAKHTTRDILDAGQDSGEAAEDSASPHGTLNVLIEARQSFGTGTHQTTQLVVSELMKAAPQGCNVLDCGCGTGILGIVAAMLGANEVAAYDVDGWCVENTRHNARLNNVSNITVMQGDASVLKSIGTLFDIVVANINRNILLADMEAFCQKMKAGATLILSGFYEADVPVLQHEAERLGMALETCRSSDEWACMVVRKD